MNRAAKAISDSNLQGLAPEQKAKLDVWLFTEGLTYKKVVELCARDFGVEVSRAGLGRYFQKENRRRAEEQAAKTPVGGDSPSVWRLGPGADRRYRELLDIIGQKALAAVSAAGRKMSLSNALEIMRLQISARREANMAQRVALAREKLEFDAATACLIHQRAIQALSEAQQMSEGDRIRAIRKELFGPDLPE